MSPNVGAMSSTRAKYIFSLRAICKMLIFCQNLFFRSFFCYRSRYNFLGHNLVNFLRRALAVFMSASLRMRLVFAARRLAMRRFMAMHVMLVTRMLVLVLMLGVGRLPGRRQLQVGAQSFERSASTRRVKMFDLRCDDAASIFKAGRLVFVGRWHVGAVGGARRDVRAKAAPRVVCEDGKRVPRIERRMNEKRVASLQHRRRQSSRTRRHPPPPLVTL